MTLVEVVLGLALLGSLLVSLLLAKTRLAHQRVEAEERLAAIHAADELLSTWEAQGEPLPQQSSGRTGEQNRFRWTTSILRYERVQDLPVEIVRLDLSEGAQTLTSIELLLPRERQARR